MKTVSDGAKGFSGPNDNGYIVGYVREAAAKIKKATMIWCDGHYPHSNAKDIPNDHPLVIALNQLAVIDKEKCVYANLEHDFKLFEPHKPTEEEKHRWDRLPG